MAKKLTLEEVRHYVEEESSSGCLLLSQEYLDSRINLEFRCSCGNNFTRRYDSFKQGNYKCRNCTGRKKWNIDSVNKFVKENSRGQCEVVSKDFVKVKEMMDFKCQCGNLFQRTFHNMQTKDLYLCNPCLGRDICNIETVRKYVESESNSGCKLLSKAYKNSASLLLFQCHCGKEFKRRFTKFKHYNQIMCPDCSVSRSKSEEYIASVLDNYSIVYNKEQSITEFKSPRGGVLRFDFSILKDKLYVEYDGEDHFYIVNRTSDKIYNLEEHLTRQVNDKIKNQYCIDNNIPLIRIPYWEFDNIEPILTSALSYYNLLNSEEEYDKELFKEFLVDENWVHDDYIAKCPKNEKKLEEGIK